jgi:Tfp pilus assembly protein PilN
MIYSILNRKGPMGVLRLSAGGIYGARWQEGAPVRVELRSDENVPSIRAELFPDTLQDSGGEMPSPGDGEDGGADSSLGRDAWLSRLAERYAPENLAELVILILVEDVGLLALKRGREIRFAHAFALEDPKDRAAEFEKGFRHLGRMTRFSTASILLIADSGATRDHLVRVLKSHRVTEPFPSVSAGVRIAAALVEESENRSRWRLPLLTSAAGLLCLAAMLLSIRSVQRSIHVMREENAALAETRDALFVKAARIEELLDPTRNAPALDNGASNGSARGWKNLLIFLGRRVPSGIVLREIRAEVSQTAGSGYSGLSEVPSDDEATHFLLRGRAENLEALAVFAETFRDSAWNVDVIERVDELPADSAYNFELRITEKRPVT